MSGPDDELADQEPSISAPEMTYVPMELEPMHSVPLEEELPDDLTAALDDNAAANDPDTGNDRGMSW